MAAKKILMLGGDFVEDCEWIRKFLAVLGTRIEALYINA